MEMEEKPSLKEYVDSKILRYTFYAREFTKEDIEFVNDYCKEFYNDDRKFMILDLIRYKTDNIAIAMLNDKIDFIYQDLLNKIDKEPEKETEIKKKVTWKGFGNPEEK